MSKGGMQTQAINQNYCKCGKPTGKLLRIFREDYFLEVSLHFGKKRTFWHKWDSGTNQITRTFKQPKEWDE